MTHDSGFQPRPDPDPDSDISIPSHRLRGEALDQRVLGELRELQDENDPHFFSQILTLYVNDSPKQMEQLRQGVTAADAVEIARVAHSLKSSSANVGAMVMSVLCAELVAAGRGGKVLQAREIFAKLEPEHGRVQAALAVEIARAGSVL